MTTDATPPIPYMKRMARLIGFSYSRSPLAPVDIVDFIRAHILPAFLSISIIPLILTVISLAVYAGVRIGFSIAILLL